MEMTATCLCSTCAENRGAFDKAGYAPPFGHEAAYRSATKENSGGGHADRTLPDRNCEKDSVADRTLVTDLSATETDDLAY